MWITFYTAKSAHLNVLFSIVLGRTKLQKLLVRVSCCNAWSLWWSATNTELAPSWMRWVCLRMKWLWRGWMGSLSPPCGSDWNRDTQSSPSGLTSPPRSSCGGRLPATPTWSSIKTQRREMISCCLTGECSFDLKLKNDNTFSAFDDGLGFCFFPSPEVSKS